MKYLLRLLLTLALLLLLFEAMIAGFHMMNLPSDLAVAGGMGLLLLTAAGGFTLLFRIWRR